MYAVMVTVNYGKGNEIHSVSGTYSQSRIDMLMEHWLSLHNLVSVEITPSL